MKLWLISQDANTDYDTYDSAVVAAEDEEAARRTCPDEGYRANDDGLFVGIGGYVSSPMGVYGSWCERADQVTVRLLGEAVDGTPAGVICASFNAG